MCRTPQTWATVVGWLVLALGCSSVHAAEPIVWPAGPLEVRIAADRPIPENEAAALVGRSITLDDRARTLPAILARPDRPASPGAAPRLALRIAATKLLDGRRTLVLATDPHPREGVYTLPTPLAGARQAARYDLSGVEASWNDGRPDARTEWSGWWPTLDPEAARQATAPSVEHRRGFALLSRPGRLTLRALPTLPKGGARLTLAANVPIEASALGEEAKVEGKTRATLAVESTGDAFELTIILRTGHTSGPVALHASYRGESDTADRPLTRPDLTLPWAPAPLAVIGEPAEPPFNLAGGDPKRGEAVFTSEQAKCSACHAIRGKGGAIGPDLTEFAGRPRVDAFRAIDNPSAEIRPDYAAYNIALKDGRVLVGTVRALDFATIRVTDTDARSTIVRRDEIDQFAPSPASIMPVGLIGVLGEDKVRDLIAFLTKK